MSDLYREYINANFSPDDDDDIIILCPDCEGVVPDKPASFTKVRDKILSWDKENGCPLEWSYWDEPYWQCQRCDRVLSLDEVSR